MNILYLYLFFIYIYILSIYSISLCIFMPLWVSKMGRNSSNSNVNVDVVATRNEMVDAMMVLSSIRIICEENSRRN